MGLESLVQEILDRGAREAGRIASEAQAQAEALRAEATRKSGEARRAREEEARRLIERVRRQELPGAELEAKKALLNAEKEALEEVYREALRRVGQIEPARNKQLLARLLERARRECPGGRILAHPRDIPMLRELGVAGPGETPIAGGLVAESDDGSYRIDYSYETLLAEAWGTEMKTVHRLLFPEGGK